MWLLRSHTIAQLSNMKHQSGNTQTQNLFTKGLIKYEKNEQTFLFLKEVKGKKKSNILNPPAKSLTVYIIYTSIPQGRV